MQVEVFIEEKPKRDGDNAESEKPQDEVDCEDQKLGSHGYHGYIRVKIFAGWGKSFGKHKSHNMKTRNW